MRIAKMNTIIDASRLLSTSPIRPHHKRQGNRIMAKHSIKGLSLFLVLLLLLLPSVMIEGSAYSGSEAAVTSLAGGLPIPTSLFPATATAKAAPRANDSSPYQSLKVYPGGIPFGVKFLTAGVLVTGFCDVVTDRGSVNPARDAGIHVGDQLMSANGTPLTGAAELTELVEGSEGKPITLQYTRQGSEFTTKLTPVRSSAESRYVTGIYVRDSGAGIGTVTFVLPKTGAFAGLGHGICDGESGELIPMDRGSVVDVTIHGVVRGLSGAPGEVRGSFTPGKSGTLLGNSHCGVWGVFAALPERLTTTPIPIGLRNELRAGKATIRCTLDSNVCEEYDVEISEIQRSSTSNKCFTVKITDPDLIAKTGGIIQGMSGSPIIQNGKLVGAVTHVLINDPTTGYGIFIENMLNAAQMPMAKAS